MKTVTITGANTFAEISDSGWNSDTLTIIFPNTTTNVGKWSVYGTATYPVTLQRTGSSGTFTLNYTGTSNISADYVNVSNGNGLPTNTWYMGANSINGGGNTGFIFAYGAVRYWVGGTGTWGGTSTTNWAYQSGYSGGAPAPTSSDDVYFDANSSAGTFTVTIDSDFVGTGSISGTTLTITAVTKGSLSVGSKILVRTTANTGFGGTGTNDIGTITAILTGTGGVGTYTISNVYYHNSTTIYSSYAQSRDLTIVPVVGMTIEGSASFICNGSFTSSSVNVTNNFAGDLIFTGSGNHTINTGGLYLTRRAFIINAAGSYKIASQILTGGASDAYVNGIGLYILRGTFDTQSYPITTGRIVFVPIATSSVALNNSILTLIYGWQTIWVASTGGLLNFNAGTSEIFTSGGNNSLLLGNNTFYKITLYSYGVIPVFCNISGAGSYIDTLSMQTNPISFSAGTYTIRKLVVNAASNSRALFFGNGITTINTTELDIKNIDFYNITAGGNIPWTGIRLGDRGLNQNITFDTPKTVYWNLAGTQNWNANGWALTSGGVPNVDNFPLPQDTAVFDNTGAAGTININAPYAIGTIDFSQRTLPVTLSSGSNTPSFYGNLTLSSAVTLSGTGTWIFAGYGVRNITSSGKTFTMPINVDMETGGVFRLQDAFANNSTASGYTFTLTRGTLDLNNNTLTLARGLTALENSVNVRGINFGTGLIYLRDFFAVGDNFTATDNGGGLYFNAGGGMFNYGSTKPNDYFTHPINVTVGPGNFSVNFEWQPTLVKNLTFVDGYTGTVSFRAARITGNLRLSAGMSVLDADSFKGVTFQGQNQTITTNGVVFRCPVYFGAAVVGSAVPASIFPNITLLDNLTVNIGDQAATGFFPHSIFLEKGTLNLNGKKITLLSNTQPNGIVSNTDARSLVFNGGSIETVTSGSTAWSFSGSNITISGPGTINMTSSSAKTFAGGNINYSGITLNQGGTGDLTITGSNTFKAISNTVRPGAIILTSSTTTTVNRLLLNGSEVQQTSLRSSVANTRANLNILDDNISSYNLIVKDISATGKSLRAPANYGNINDGNNLNCNFSNVNKILDDNFSLFGNLIVV